MQRQRKNMSWMTWVLFVCLLWIYLVSSGKNEGSKSGKCWKNIFQKLRQCLRKSEKKHVVVADNFRGFINAEKHWTRSEGCIVFLPKNTTKTGLCKRWPQMVNRNGSSLLLISKWHINKKFHLCVLNGNESSALADSECVFKHTTTEPCQTRCLDTETICDRERRYNENKCSKLSLGVGGVYVINTSTTESNCLNCKNRVEKPEEKVKINATLKTEEGEKLDATQAVDIMKKMADLVYSISGSSAELTVGEEVTGILVRETVPEDVDEVSFAYASPNDSMSIVDGADELAQYSRSITVSKEAFEKAVSLNVSMPFAAILRFNNLALDEKNSTVLGDEVLAIEMGTVITNLTDKLNINFRNMEYEGIPSCHSWNGDGSRPNWTEDGCLTIKNGSNITCECSHLTFFAILLTPLNETISSSDLKNLTIITQVGCGLSMFFLSIALFMHFLLRRKKASIATLILINLVSAMFLLNLTFLINNFVAEMTSSVGCKIMAALMHYFMLATFTWFAVQAFHLCLQLYVGGKIVIRHYILKVSITSWGLPSVVVIVLLIIGKYGEQVISTSDAEEDVKMCWITDNDVHFIVNIGYYALVFLFTFSTFIVILSWLFCLKRTSTAVQVGSNGRSIVVLLGLCCLLGITWGFAFFAYGALRIPSYYIFTALNSFQGFFLFIYYYNTSHSAEVSRDVGVNNSSASTTSTLKTVLDSVKNPYSNQPDKEIKED
ncbi:adhesion G-protein coupled receptor G6-like [Sebastes umbrosus]|uniref:adhesion G-protein coupled receptor G6-like n=1 Tax=Sebastes umbrosus TaxID=72105 RepID=UPI0018A0AE20|nr:adhesion G-protein coupled receptor G6-like [Sebastes umbrosus]